nr:uncharacterized protein LOC129382677 [Dermacentor andersoni]
MEQQRSMMMSRAMSQRSVVIRPATQETGGMMQYLLTIVFLICAFWVVIGALYFIYGKRGAGKTTPDDEGGVAVPACKHAYKSRCTGCSSPVASVALFHSRSRVGSRPRRPRPDGCAMQGTLVRFDLGAFP